MEMVSYFCIDSICLMRPSVINVWGLSVLYVYASYMLIWMMVSLEGLVLYLLCVDKWRISKRNAAEILND